MNRWGKNAILLRANDDKSLWDKDLSEMIDAFAVTHPCLYKERATPKGENGFLIKQTFNLNQFSLQFDNHYKHKSTYVC